MVIRVELGHLCAFVFWIWKRRKWPCHLRSPVLDNRLVVQPRTTQLHTVFLEQLPIYQCRHQA